MRRCTALGIIATMVAAGFTPQLRAQSTIHVIGSDSVPVPFATVFIQGGAANIADEHGNLAMRGKRQVLNAEVRRIGYTPWFGKITLPDTAATITIVLPNLAQQLSSVTVSAASAPASVRLMQSGFYDRVTMRQKGALSATFIGPEEIEKRHPSRMSDLLQGLSGVSIMRTPLGGMVARGNGGSCYMAVVLDGQRLCPPMGCHTAMQTSDNATPLVIKGGRIDKDTTFDDVTVNINQFVEANDIVAVEVYGRGANMPISLQAVDNACGVIAIWTGSRHP
jgi:hypothetical protein